MGEIINSAINFVCKETGEDLIPDAYVGGIPFLLCHQDGTPCSHQEEIIINTIN